MQSTVAAQNFTGSGDDVAGLLRQRAALLLQVAFDELHVISRWARNRFPGSPACRQPERPVRGAMSRTSCLGKFAQRKIGAGQLFLGQAEKK